MTDTGNLLYYGDNLDVLRRHVKDETVDLVYLAPISAAAPASGAPKAKPQPGVQIGLPRSED